ncbi:MAG TPA: hypothetical protein VMV18_06305 [bacterium]|nr:hypothetical protein [bacterium]
MRVPELAVLYALIGAGLAVAVVMRGHSAGEGAILLALWPLYGPFLVFADAPAGPGAASGEAAFAAAMRRAAGTPLAALLPEPRAARALARRLRLAETRVAEIDALLRRPEFDEADARARFEELRARGDADRAAVTADHRVRNIARLRALRARFARELDEVRELIAQLTTQAEVVRLSGELDDTSAGLVRELVHRVEGLDDFLEGDAV